MKFDRVLNRDGSYNAIRYGVKKAPFSDSYHSLLTITWRKFSLLMLAGYLLINLFFAALYFLCGKEGLQGSSYDDCAQRFLDCFFFSVQTFATIGYGKLVPNSLATNILVTFEALVGLMSVAVSTGLVFSRFSRPTARVIFSNAALITQHLGKPALMFRMANERANQIVDATVNITLIITVATPEGSPFRKVVDLPLQRSRSPIFANSWTVVHLIDEKSPLYGVTKESMIESEMEMIVSLVGTDDIFSQSVHSRFSYTPHEIEWNKVFVDMLHWKDGVLKIELDKIHAVRPI